MLAWVHLSPLKILVCESNFVSRALSYSLWFDYTRGAHYLLKYFGTKCVLRYLLAVIICYNIAVCSHQARHTSFTQFSHVLH